MDTTRQAGMLADRVRKNFRRLHRPFERDGVGAFRVYDWDVPEIRAAVDWYEGHLVVAEYERAQTREAAGWLEAMGSAAASALEVPAERVHLKRRRTRPAQGSRYGRLGHTGERIAVRERGLRLWTNLDDFIDTGLFPDHREMRARVRAEAHGSEFLNLFGYTGAFTCAAAAGGARRTVTVDTSEAYLAWAPRQPRAERPGRRRPRAGAEGRARFPRRRRTAVQSVRAGSAFLLGPDRRSVLRRAARSPRADRARPFDAASRRRALLLDQPPALRAPAGKPWRGGDHARDRAARLPAHAASLLPHRQCVSSRRCSSASAMESQ